MQMIPSQGGDTKGDALSMYRTRVISQDIQSKICVETGSLRRLSITGTGQAYVERCMHSLAEIDELADALGDMSVTARIPRCVSK